jgi:hypothetical protein
MTTRGNAEYPCAVDGCDTPPTGLPGDTWICPKCGKAWWAEDEESETGVFIRWVPE